MCWGREALGQECIGAGVHWSKNVGGRNALGQECIGTVVHWGRGVLG